MKIFAAFILFILVGCAAIEPEDKSRPKFPEGCPSPSAASRATSCPRLFDLITLERGACYGLCPVYSISINSTGKVTFIGKENTGTLGQKTRQMSPETFKTALSFLEDNEFWSFNDNYTQHNVEDHATVLVSVGSFPPKFVTHYLGDASAPKALHDIENKLDELLETDQWVKKN